GPRHPGSTARAGRRYGRRARRRRLGYSRRRSASTVCLSLAERGLQELEGTLRERPHVLLSVSVARLERDHVLDGARPRDARLPGCVTVAVAGRPGGAGRGEAARGAQ